jgi:hypothetical protein
VTVSRSGSEPIALNTFTLVDTSEIKGISPEYLEEATLEDLTAPVWRLVKKTVESVS